MFGFASTKETNIFIMFKISKANVLERYSIIS